MHGDITVPVSMHAHDRLITKLAQRQINIWFSVFGSSIIYIIFCNLLIMKLQHVPLLARRRWAINYTKKINT
jgi:hypothetical protein